MLTKTYRVSSTTLVKFWGTLLSSDLLVGAVVERVLKANVRKTTTMVYIFEGVVYSFKNFRFASMLYQLDFTFLLRRQFFNYFYSAKQADSKLETSSLRGREP